MCSLVLEWITQAVASAFHVEVRAGDLNSVFPTCRSRTEPARGRASPSPERHHTQPLGTAEDHAGVLGDRSPAILPMAAGEAPTMFLFSAPLGNMVSRRISASFSSSMT